MYTELISQMLIKKVCFASTLYNAEGAKNEHSRNRWGVLIKYEGETVYTVRGKRFLSNLNHIVLLPNGCNYAWECTKSGRLCIIDFECDLTYHEPIVFSVKSPDKILKMFKELEYKRSLNRPTVELESIRDVYSILLALLQAIHESYVQPEKQRRITHTLEYMALHYREELTNDLLAGEAGLSTTYFRRLFTAYVGMPPIAYLHKLRIDKAKEMLKSDYAKISDIAEYLGYASIYDFSRDFKKHTGVAPSRY